MNAPPKVFLTGASSGLGAALARRYAAQGATLGLVARREAELAALAASLAPAKVAAYAADVRDAAAMTRAGADFVARFGAPDVVIGNAGISRGTLTEHAEDLPAFRSVLETNVLGLVHTFHPFIAAMTAAGSGALVGIASVAGFRGLPGSGAYCASKSAAITYLESLRVELRARGVAVLTICPGFIATPLTARNPYKMPFLIQADEAARQIARAIGRRQRFRVVPPGMAALSVLLRALPRPLYDRVVQNRKRKPRDNKT
jgi:short-subunit dehydrogenase